MAMFWLPNVWNLFFYYYDYDYDYDYDYYDY